MSIQHWYKKKQFIFSFGILSITFVFFVALLGWSVFSHIDESVLGVGEFIPSGKLRRIMSPINGTVVRLHVKEHQFVKAGQPLLELDPEYYQTEKQGYINQLTNFQDQITVLESAYKGVESIHLSDSDFGNIQRRWLKTLQHTSQVKLNSAHMQVSKTEHLYLESIERAKSLKSLLESTEQMRKQYQELYEKGGLPLKDLQEYEQKTNRIKGDLTASKEEIEARRLEWEQAKYNPETIRGELEQQLLERVTNLKNSMTEFENSLNKVAVTLEHQIIKAPIDGIVHGLDIHGAGEYTPAGTVLFSLVPKGSELIAEVKVTNQDLSYIHLNQKTLLQIDAFPFQQFGKLEGLIQSISPSTLKDAKGFPYYIVKIKPEHQTMIKENKKLNLKAGMTLNAQIITRNKNIMSFFVEPIVNQLENAFRDPSKY